MPESAEQRSADAPSTDLESPTAAPHSIEYVRRVLEEAELADPDGLRRAKATLIDKTLQVTVETQERDETFWVLTDVASIVVTGTEPDHEPTIALRVTPDVARDILQGEETPIEAFFLGRLRARGTTRNLYALQAFFMGVAQIAISVPSILDLVEDFQERKS